MKKIKRSLYFLVANYFVFWAKLVLIRWRPKVIVVTGSTGKSTLFYLLKAQLGEVAEFADDANSAFGIPFNILRLKRTTFNYGEWIGLIARAPWQALQPIKKDRKKVYIVEADSDRPGEAKLLAGLLQPSMVMIMNVFKTHAANFEGLVANGQVPDVLTAIGDEFATFAQIASEEVLINGNNAALVKAVERLGLQDKVEFLEEQDYLTGYQVTRAGTIFMIGDTTYNLPALLPQEVWLSLVMAEKVGKFLNRRIDFRYMNLTLPAGRSSLLAGVGQTTLIDSTYNANLGSMTAMIKLFELYPASGQKWLVLGHMVEEGGEAKKEHEDLAWLLLQLKTVSRVFLLGKENKEVVLPILQKYMTMMKIEFCETPKIALERVKAELRGGETILFKGAPFLEGMVEQLLADPRQAGQLVRREEVWQKRRQSFYN